MGLFDAIKKAFNMDNSADNIIEVETLYPRSMDDSLNQNKLNSSEVVVEVLMPNINESDIISKVIFEESTIAIDQNDNLKESERINDDYKEDNFIKSDENEDQSIDTQDEDYNQYENDLDQGLNKTTNSWSQRWNKFMSNFRQVDENFFEDLEETLIKADVGAETAFTLTDELRDEVKLQNAKSKEDVSKVILQKLVDYYMEQGRDEDVSMHFSETGPTVIFFVGVNGVGKTTTIGKLAARYKQEGKKVLLAAADTFRAGATKQLQVWGEKDGIEVISGAQKSDPASVVFNGVRSAIDQKADILFVDTAGRLQNNVNLMQELAKMKRIIERELPDQPSEVLLVLDSTTGQNALQQAKLFKNSTDVTGIVLTKLDGTAKGGIILPIRNELHLPVKWVGIGEKTEDLKPFDSYDFVKSLFGPLLEL